MFCIGVFRGKAPCLSTHEAVNNWQFVTTTSPDYGHKKRGLLPGYANGSPMMRAFLMRFLAWPRTYRWATGLVFAALALVAYFAFPPYASPDYPSVRNTWRSSTATLSDRHGVVLSSVRVDLQARRGVWVAYDDLPPALVNSLVQSEDRRFYLHAGVDLLSTASAVWQRLRHGDSKRGASTITMQLAARLHPELAVAGKRTLSHKWRQMRQAIAIEWRWRKRDIVEAWINTLPFRGDLEGIDSASRVLLGKPPKHVTAQEAAVLAALLPGPNAPATLLGRRACVLTTSTPADCNTLTQLAHDMVARYAAPRDRINAPTDIAPHVARQLLTPSKQSVRSTLDANVQRAAFDAVRKHVQALSARAGGSAPDAAVLALDNASGDVLAWVGSAGDLSSAAHIDGVRIKRMAGSTLKPFLYALALERKDFTAATLLDDSPVALPLNTGDGYYMPANYDRGFQGPISVRNALAASINMGAIRTIMLTGVEPFLARLRASGISTLQKPATHYGHALALGGAEVTLLELTNAYRMLANGGRALGAPTLIAQGASTAVQVHDARATFIVSDILADGPARLFTFRGSNPLETPYRSSVKTGTSNDMRDNWTLGYSTGYTVGVWVGYFDGAPMLDVSGVEGAAYIWRDVMDALHASAPPPSRAPPPGLLKQRVTWTRQQEPSREEWFISGTEIAVADSALVKRNPKVTIVSPEDLTQIKATSPAQHITLRASNAPPRAQWWFDNGEKVPARASVDAYAQWPVRAGRHRVTLVDADGTPLALSVFSVQVPTGAALVTNPARQK